MLVLSRKPSQSIMIGSDIKVTIVKVERNQVRIGIEAPRGVTILRDELVEFGKDDAECQTFQGRGLAEVEIVTIRASEGHGEPW